MKHRGSGSVTDSLHYNLQGWLTEKSSARGSNAVFTTNLRYYAPAQPSTVPSYTGNITEWSWRQGADASENTYAFSYDPLSRLISTRQYIDGAANDRFVEKGLSYDRNGNILSLQRYASGAVADNFTYAYSGNQLTALSGTTTGSYRYDPNGNMTRDGVNNLDLSYNHLNRLEKVTRDGAVVANYCYLSDGTKLSATDAAGDGLVYRGSLVYRKQGSTLSLESASFNGGRFVATNNVVEPHYFIMDHLGSVRAVVDSRGEVKERSDYYPYGLRWDDAGSQVSDNRYRYNGKEDQAFLNVPYTDYGARMYDANKGRFFNVDRYLEKYKTLSPYHYAANNPIKNIDINGDSVRIYIETRSNYGLGHTWMSTGEGENMTVYTYGRYAGTNPSTLMPSALRNGPGVLVKLTGEAAQTYNSGKSDLNPESFTITDVDDVSADSYFQGKLDSSTETPTQGEYKGNSNAKIIDNYSLTTNNCATTVSDALNSLGSASLQRPTSDGNVVIGNRLSAIPINSQGTQPIKERFILPASLRGQLRK